MEVRNLFFAFLILLLGLIGYLIIAPFLQYVLAAALLAFILYPVHTRLRPRTSPRISAALLTGLAIIVAVVPILLISMILIDTIVTFLNDIQDSDVQQAIETFQEFLDETLGIDSELLDRLSEIARTEFEDFLLASVETVLSEMITIIDATIHMAVGFMLLVFLVYYFLLDGTRLLHWIRSISPLESEENERLLDEIKVVTWAVVQSHLLVAIVEGILGGIGLYLVGISNVAFWTVIMIVASILPIIGVWLVWAPAVIYLLATGDIFGALFLLAYGIAVLSVIDNYLRAVFVDKGSGLHPAVVLIGVIGGIYLLGVLGLFIGPILLAVLKASVTVFSESYTSSRNPA